MDTITVYTKPACVQCNATFRALNGKELATPRSTSAKTRRPASTCWPVTRTPDMESVSGR